MARHFRERAVGALLATALVLLGAPAEAGLNPEFTLYGTSNSTFFMDYDGDGFPDRIVGYGAPGDVGLLADVDGDTLWDLIVYRNGAWLIDLRNDGGVDVNLALGGPADVPVAADFLGLGKAGIGIYRPSNGTWYLDQDANGAIDHISTFGGAPGDQPVVADYDGDGRADRAIYNDGVWTVDFGLNTTVDGIHFLGGEPNDIALAGDFDGDWKADNAVFRDGVWLMDYGNDSTVNRTYKLRRRRGDRPLFGPVNPAASRFVRAGAVGGNGTQALPYGTIAAAQSGAPSGTIIRIAAGSYAEAVAVFRRQNLTYLGAGVEATHLNGSGDAVSVFESQNIALRNLHVESPNGRGIVNQGSSMTLDRITTLENWSHNVLGVNSGPNTATLLIESSNIDTSRMGNGLRLEGGVVATVRRSTIDKNGTDLTEPRPTTGNGRGVESFGDSQLTLEYSSVSSNYDGGLLVVGTSSAIVRFSAINLNGTNGLFFMNSPRGDVYGNNILDNGVAGARGAVTGYNGIEVFDGWAGPSLAIHENWIFRSTGSGMYIGGSSVNVPVANNYFYDNFLGLTIANAVTVTAQGNLFELPPAQGAEEGILIVGPGPVVTVGGPGAQNTFRNYLNVGGASPAIHCGGTPAPAVSCSAGGNVWDNVDLRVLGCPATCSSS